MLITNTKTVIHTCMKRPEGKKLRMHDVLKLTYNEMIADECECEIHQKWNYLIKDWENVKAHYMYVIHLTDI